MHWLYLALALAALFGALRTTSPALMGVLLLAAVVLMIAWVLRWMSARLGSQHDDGVRIDPELERLQLRQQIEAQRKASVNRSEDAGAQSDP